jgi:hypothetical protein
MISYILLLEKAMTPDRRKVLKGMIAAMAANGMSVGERRAALAATVGPFARKIGKKLADDVNQFFGADQIVATAQHFREIFGNDGGGYKFGHWILVHDTYLGKPQTPGMSDAEWQQLIDQDMEPEVTGALTAAIRECLIAHPPKMIEFVCDDKLSGSKYHALDISTSRKPKHFKGQDGRIISLKCNEA